MSSAQPLAFTHSSDPIARLLAAFFAGRSPHTIDAYGLDLDDFAKIVRRYSLQAVPPLANMRALRAEAIRSFVALEPGSANELVFAYRNELLTRSKSTATIARRISVVKSL